MADHGDQKLEPSLVSMWWGPIDGTLHLFETLTVGPGSTIRNGSPARCGWRPDVPLLESPEEPYRSVLCRTCLDQGPPLERIEQIRWLLANVNPAAHAGGQQVFGDMRFLLEQVDKLHAFIHGPPEMRRG